MILHQQFLITMKFDRIIGIFIAVMLSASIYSVPMQSLAEQPPPNVYYLYRYYPQPYWNRPPPPPNTQTNRLQFNQPQGQISRPPANQKLLPQPAGNRYMGQYGYPYYWPGRPGYAPAYTPPAKKPSKPVAVPKKHKSMVMQVRITEQGFQPARVLIKAGDRVLWANIDEEPHRVSSQSGFNSKFLTRGATYVRIFKKPGVYTYFCGLESNMKGLVIVK